MQPTHELITKVTPATATVLRTLTPVPKPLCNQLVRDVLDARPVAAQDLRGVAALVPKDPLSAYQAMNRLLAEQLGSPPPRWRETNWVQEVFAVFEETHALFRLHNHVDSLKDRHRGPDHLRLEDALNIIAKRRGRSAQVFKMRLCWYNNAQALHEKIKAWMHDGTLTVSCMRALFPFGTMRPLSKEAIDIVVTELQVAKGFVSRLQPRHVAYAVNEAALALGKDAIWLNKVRYELNPSSASYARNKKPYA